MPPHILLLIPELSIVYRPMHTSMSCKITSCTCLCVRVIAYHGSTATSHGANTHVSTILIQSHIKATCKQTAASNSSMQAFVKLLPAHTPGLLCPASEYSVAPSSGQTPKSSELPDLVVALQIANSHVTRKATYRHTRAASAGG